MSSLIRYVDGRSVNINGHRKPSENLSRPMHWPPVNSQCLHTAEKPEVSYNSACNKNCNFENPTARVRGENDSWPKTYNKKSYDTGPLRSCLIWGVEAFVEVCTIWSVARGFLIRKKYLCVIRAWLSYCICKLTTSRISLIPAVTTFRTVT